MTQKELDRIRALNRQIAGEALLLEEIRQRAYPGAIQYDDTGGSRPAPVNKLEIVMCLLDRQERRLDSLIDERHDLMKRATAEIRAKCEDPAQRHVLYLRYYRGLEWREVMDAMYKHHNIKARRVYALHHIAVNNLK